MALIQCDECGNEISDKAEACPRCGAPVAGESAPSSATPAPPKPRKKVSAGRVALLLGVVLGVPVLGLAAVYIYMYVAQSGGVERVGANTRGQLDGTIDAWNTSLMELEGGMERFHNDPQFGDEDRLALVKKAEDLTAIVRERPKLFGDVVEQSERLTEIQHILRGTTIGHAVVDANRTVDTGIKLEPGWTFRVDVVEGQWAASGDTNRWPKQDGSGYPNYQPGLLDYRVCSSVTMGALIWKAGGKCGEEGTKYRYSGERAMLRLQMNDNDLTNNAGELKVRYLVTHDY